MFVLSNKNRLCHVVINVIKYVILVIVRRINQKLAVEESAIESGDIVNTNALRYVMDVNIINGINNYNFP